MINGLIILILYLLVGDIISEFLSLPVPGGIIGMILMFITFVVRGKIDTPVNDAARGLIAYIGLLFVPAGVGISLYFDLLAAHWGIILFAGISSMLLTLCISAAVFTLLLKIKESQK